jgi:hypothetical protein
MLIFTEEIIEANPGLRAYIDAKPYLLDLNYEADKTSEEFLEFNKHWLPFLFGTFENKDISLKLFRRWRNLPDNNLVKIDVKKIINSNYYGTTVMNYCIFYLFSDEEDDIDRENRIELISILIEFGARTDQFDRKRINDYKNYLSKIEDLFI